MGGGRPTCVVILWVKECLMKGGAGVEGLAAAPLRAEMQNTTHRGTQ